MRASAGRGGEYRKHEVPPRYKVIFRGAHVDIPFGLEPVAPVTQWVGCWFNLGTLTVGSGVRIPGQSHDLRFLVTPSAFGESDQVVGTQNVDVTAHGEKGILKLNPPRDEIRQVPQKGGGPLTQESRKEGGESLLSPFSSCVTLADAVAYVHRKVKSRPEEMGWQHTHVYGIQIHRNTFRVAMMGHTGSK